MINVNQTAKTLDEGIKNLMAGAKLDYEKWSTLGGKELTGYAKEQVDNWDNKTKVSEGKQKEATKSLLVPGLAEANCRTAQKGSMSGGVIRKFKAF